MTKKKRLKSFDSIVSETYREYSREDMKSNPETNYPLFGFKYLFPTTHKDCKDAGFFKDFLMRLKKLSDLGWREIEKSPRHSFGSEKIPIEQLHPNFQMPEEFKTQKRLTVFRATGNNHVFAGVRQENTFHILFIESEFGTLYDHN